MTCRECILTRAPVNSRHYSHNTRDNAIGHDYIRTFVHAQQCQGEIVLHPAEQGQKARETVVQGLHFLSFRTAHLIYMYMYIYVYLRLPQCFR